METVDIHLLGRSYQIACPSEEKDRLAQLALMLEDKMKQAAKSGQGAIGEIRLFLLAGLMLADDVLEARSETDNSLKLAKADFSKEEDILVAAVDHLAGRMNALAARIEKT